MTYKISTVGDISKVRIYCNITCHDHYIYITNTLYVNLLVLNSLQISGWFLEEFASYSSLL